ncbi:alanyl-tRNA synthetase [Penicillium psychrosexuale]|uniref:alanyl-tRNA synthetase n=1 Tax=Penicillium psychrosexuale TaxID=1002107 RepID=UPI002544D7AF|nr:alanyl-tRNA synthetase [Penicillium psychrosexuale]KAJ5790843.1 alanyl-tRNA synthetase [Penicillium psychrosexuale]
MALQPNKWPAKTVRDTFLDFYKERNHIFTLSSSVIPHNDPTLLFTNAGMNQYKSIFLGTVDPHADFAYLKRATNSQKCIRAGGKHNDLDDVGKDNYHHTFFEMLGNWSFGDYFKQEAAEYSWELLTCVFGLDPSRLYITYFEGYAPLGLGPDIDAQEIWRAIGVPDDHIIPGNMKDNFWEMGSQGPCGPCSEVHYDRVGGRNAAYLVNQDDPDVVEIWNIVFIQFNREADKSLRSLPNKHIDTGLGFERLVSIVQDKSSNYDTDLFSPLFEKIQEITGARPYQGKFGAEDDGIDTAYRVVADHVRTCTVAISDGAVPDSVGRGYVVRRILRRGVRYARKYFDAKIGSFFSKIVPTVVEQIGDIFPEVRRNEQTVKEILNEEEEAFALTLDRGEAMFGKYAQKCHESGSKDLPGAYVWRLYDTYGFPVDLTKLMAEEQGLNIDEDEVSAAQEMAREASKGEKKSASDLVTLDVHDLAALENIVGMCKTDDVAKYRKGSIQSTIKALYYGKTFVTSTSDVPNGAQFGVLLDKTNFYAEAGGQIFDTGRLVIDDVAEIDVRNVQSYGAYVLHTGYMKYGILKIGDTAEKSGSLVAPEKLRFDFSHKSGLTEEEIERVQEICHNYIKDDRHVFVADVTLENARRIEGVRTIVGETYPDPTRVVSIGVPVNALVDNVSKNRWTYSVELCGGTHVDRTGEIKDMVLLEESGIAKGVRRIVAATGQEAQEARQNAARLEEHLVSMEQMSISPEKEALVKQAQAELATSTISILDKKLFARRPEGSIKEMMKEQKETQRSQVDAAINHVKTVIDDNPASTSFVVNIPTDCSAKVITEAIKHVSSIHDDKSVYFIGVDATGRVAHGCFVSPKHISNGLVANEWAAQVAKVVGGKAGGKGLISMGSGPDKAKVEDGMVAARMYLQELRI